MANFPYPQYEPTEEEILAEEGEDVNLTPQEVEAVLEELEAQGLIESVDPGEGEPESGGMIETDPELTGSESDHE